MLTVRPAIVVEGKYDKIKLASLVDALIIPTDGFGIFKDREKIELLRRLAVTRGLLILTDSDGAGFLIRNRLKQLIPKGEVYHGYIPDVYGKEKRKRTPSAEGKLGVEGMSEAVLQQVLSDAGIACGRSDPRRSTVTKADLMGWGLAGGAHAAAKRQALQQRLGLPARMSANTLLEVLQRLYTVEELLPLLEPIEEQGESPA